ncbi:hypothetical protein ABZ917_01120 [Nonomuraea wenchangensis]
MITFLDIPAIVALLLIGMGAIPAAATMLVRACLPLVDAVRELRVVLSRRR